MASSELPTIDLGLEGRRLRAWRQGDAPSLARHADNVNVRRWMPTRLVAPVHEGSARSIMREG